MFDFISDDYKKSITLLYEITDEKIIIGGSVALRLQNIINRDTSDIDLNMIYSDWDTYKNIIYKNFKVYPMKTVYNSNLGGNILCYLLTEKNNKINFNLFINYVPNMFDVIEYQNKNIRLFKPELIMFAKEQMFESDPELIKHKYDIDKIKNFLYETK